MSSCHLAVMKKFLCGRPAMALPSLIGWLLHITLVRGENTGQTVSTTVAGGEGEIGGDYRVITSQVSA